MKNYKKNRGSLTVEAVISVTVFISVMFMLLTMVKMVLFMTVLNNATVETAKILATSGYPIVLLNDLQEDTLDTTAKQFEPASLQQSLQTGLTDTFLTGIFSGNVIKTGAQNVAGALTGFIEGAIAQIGSQLASEVKAGIAQNLCATLVKEYVEDCGLYIDQEKLILRAVKIPETNVEFTARGGAVMPLSADGALQAQPGIHFGQDDVVVCLEYPYEIALPLLPAFEVTLRSTSVERAWVNGTGSGPVRTEGIDVSNWLDKAIYEGSGGYSKRYHRRDCITIKGHSRLVTVSDAIARKLTPCKVCQPGRIN